jgi:hypothetical protein
MIATPVRRPVDVGLADPDPAARLAFWRELARRHISAEMCDRLARADLPELALEPLRQRGDLS